MDIMHFGKSGGSDILQLVSFRLGKEEFAVDILKIQEINRLVEITRVPKSPMFVEGVINLRGKVIPVIDLRKKLALSNEERNDETRIVVMDIRKRIVGLIVDSVSEVLRAPARSVEPPPPMLGGIDSEYIKGVCKLEDRLLILLDVNKLLSMEEAEMLEDPTECEAVKSNSASDGDEVTMEYRGMAGMVEVKKNIADVIDNMSNGENISKKDFDKLVIHVKGLLEGNFFEDDLELYGELGEMAKYINETKKSLRTFNAAEITDKDLPEASDQLESIVESTEDATNNILTVTENMLDDQDKITNTIDLIKSLKFTKKSDNSEKRDQIVSELEKISESNTNGLMDIMSACNFQDLTGQRIQKIVALVKTIEGKIMKIILTFNIKRKEKSGDLDENVLTKEKDMLAKIENMELKGPSKKGEGVNQAEVDDLLGDLFG